MIILVVNNGSTSSRFSVFNAKNNELLAEFAAERIGTDNSYFRYINNRGNKIIKENEIHDCFEATNLMYQYIFNSDIGVLNSPKDISVIGYRVVHGGEKYTEATFIDDKVLKDISNFSNMVPIHNKKIMELIEVCRNKFVGIDNVAVFDTAFHSTIPRENFLYAIPLELYEKYGIRKYGFHGISYNYVLNRYCQLQHMTKNNTNIIICHLGGGSSICSIQNGESIDTTMGYTPLSGLIMTSRSGNVDPAVIPKIMRIYDITAEQAIILLNENSGYLALCGEKDMKSIVDRSASNDQEAIFLRKMIDIDFKKNLLSMMANTKRIDSIILTGGVGAKNIEQRELLLSNLEQFGIELNKTRNQDNFNMEGIISNENSKIPIFVIPTDEEKEIAIQCSQLVKRRKI